MIAPGPSRHASRKPWAVLVATAAVGAVFATGLSGCDADSGSKGATKSSPGSGGGTHAAESSRSATALKAATAAGVQIQVPSDWHLSKQPNGTAGGAPPPSGSSLPPAVFSLQSTPDPLGTTDEAAKSSLRHAGKTGKRLSDLKVNGVSLYHVQYKTPGFFRDDFGAIVNGVFYTISWNFGTEGGITRAEADKYMNPVMATFKLTS